MGTENENSPPAQPRLTHAEQKAMAMEAITQAAFIRRRGMYMATQFVNPPIHAIEGMEMPIGSVVHYLPEEDKDYAPDETWWLLRGQPPSNQVWVEHMMEFKANYGRVRKLTGDPDVWIRRFHMRHPTLKRVINRKTALGMDNSLLVVNHALARHWYEYNNNRYLSYQMARNTRDNAIDEVARMVDEVDRVHYIPVRMPTKLYELSKINRAVNEGEDLQIESIRRFGTVEGLFFLDLWRFIANPKESHLGTKIDQKNWSRVNLILYCNNRWFMLNLANIEEWVTRKPSKVDPKNPDAVEATDGKWSVERMQKIFLNDIITLIESAQDAAKKPSLGNEAPVLPEQTDAGAQSTAIREQLNQQVGSTLVTKTLGKEDSLEEPKDGTSESLLTKGRQGSLNKESSKRYSLDSKSRASKKSTKMVEVVETPKQVTDEEIDRNIEALEKVDAIVEAPENAELVSPHVNPLEAGIIRRAQKLARDGVISAGGLQQAERLAVAYKDIPNPFGDGLAYEAAQVTPEEVIVESKKIPTRSKRIFDESMNFSTIEDMTTKYVRKTYKKDILNCIFSIQKSGVAVTGIEVDKVTTISGSQLVIYARTKGLNGAQSTLPIILPDFNENGTYESGGTTYRLKQQRQDVPIRLVKPGLVYLTSAYPGKISIARSNKKVFEYGEWVRNIIAGMEMEGHPLLQGSEHNNVFDQSVKAPYPYTMLANRFSVLRLGKFALLLDRKEIEKTFSEAERRKHENSEQIIAGIDDNNKPVLMNYGGEIFVGGVSQGTVEQILDINVNEAPHEAAMISIRNQMLPLGVVIASYIGLNRMLDHMGTKVRRVQVGQRQDLQWFETYLRFNDELLIIDTRDRKSTLLLMGFKQYAKQIRQLSIYGFDRSHSYHHLFDAHSRSSAIATELELLDERFVDPMTERVLKEMKEPTEWQGLLWRAAEMLVTDYSPDEMDGNFMQFKLHERINAMVYAEMTNSLRAYKRDSRITKASLDLKPTAVWSRITKDAAISPINNCNPIADLRAQEAVTYIGYGGRSKRSMVGRHRKFNRADMGVIGMDTVDSGDTGINIQTSANPNVKTTAGRSETGSAETTGVSSMVSTTMLLYPCIDIDHPRRAVFASIQIGSGIAAKGYRPMPLGTGYEEMVAGRVDKAFAYVATGKGKVLSHKNDVIRIQYEDGRIEAIETGLVITVGEGHSYPNDVKVTVQPGDSFDEGDTIAFNDSWFEQSPHDPKLVSLKIGIPTWVMLSENANTLEDGSLISPELGEALTSSELATRELVFSFKDAIHNLVTLGTHLEPDDILCTIERSSTLAGELIGADAIDSLNQLVDNSPRSKYHGEVVKVEIRYNGDIEDINPVTAKLVQDSDKRIRLKSKDLGKEVDSGRTDESQRVDGQPLQIDTLVVRIHIKHSAPAAAGDKAVMSAQLKTVPGQVAVAPIITESGRHIGMNYSDNGVESRVVRGPRKAGMLNACLIAAGNRFVNAYRGK